VQLRFRRSLRDPEHGGDLVVLVPSMSWSTKICRMPGGNRSMAA
jgi:hypothetical protein